MKLNFLNKILLIIILVIFGGIVFHAPLTVWLSSFLPFELLLKAWKEILIIAGLIILFNELIKQQKWQLFYKSWAVRLPLLFVLIHLICLGFWWQGLTPSLAGLLIDLRFIGFFWLVYGFILLNPQFKKIILAVCLWSAAISLGFALLQIFVLPKDFLEIIGYGRDTIVSYLTVDNNPDFIRINGTLRGPNPLGAYALTVICLALSAWLVLGIKKMRQIKNYLPELLGFLIVSACLALWFSYSRSALIATLGAILLMLSIVLFKKAGRLLVVFSGCALVILLFLLSNFWQSSFVQHVILHENSAGGSLVSSNDEHFESLNKGWRGMIAQPFGAGVGSTGSASLYGQKPIIIENQYLFIAHEAGWLGLIVFVALVGFMLFKFWHNRQKWLSLGLFCSGLALSAVGFLLPVWADDTVSLIWWGLAGLALALIDLKTNSSQSGKET